LAVIISRFAPAPTGYLHLGHVLNALYVWSLADRVLLRIEDHDRQRSRPEYEAAIVEDLEWLGFRWHGAIVRQSARGDIYSQSLDRLRAQGLVYACGCSRTAVYPGTCRDRGLADGPGLSLRVRLEPSLERFVDLRLGPQEQRPHEQCGDVVVRDREGNWTYQFAATVDDIEQGVTHVIRGADLLDSTGRQIQLARLLGRPTPPRFLHHPLIMKAPAQKLSKSDRDTAVRELRAQGLTPAQVVARAVSSIITP
jgi:glutamyl-tRNA synthetase/glutamyl-Q tRNA(Asp) synthetase